MADTGPHRLAANVAALRRWDAHCADRITSAPADPEILGQSARDGTVSIVAMQNGRRQLQIHSRYRPTEEARRTVAALPPTATLIVHGLGAAFIPREYLSRHRSSSVIVTERSHATVRAILEVVDLTAELNSGRLRITTTPAELTAAIEAVHLPMIRDGIQSVELTSWVSRDTNRDHFTVLHGMIPAVLQRIAEEVATMRHFGRPWLAHTVENTFCISWDTIPERIEKFRRETDRRPARVLAAGPGLDGWFSDPPPPQDT
ncbi:MAG: hypothetical protein PF508_19685, partial [Spirochaeta sp.]|nr:hypothetical protein [Spirochaeta sp.]